MNKGTVLFFHEEKGYGFIGRDGDLEDAKGLFFHITRFNDFICNGGDVPVIGRGWKNVPQRDMRVFFDEEDGPEGPRATKVASVDSYKAAMDAVRSRPLVRLRERVGKIPKSKLWDKPTYKVLWQGYDLTALRREFPCRKFPTFNNDDRARVFERKESDEWVGCTDPR